MSESTQPIAELSVESPANNHRSLLHSKPQKVTAGRGLKWLTEGWALMMKEPLVFAVMSLISLVSIFVVGLVPILGSIVITLFWPVIIAGFFLAFKHAKQQQSVTANDLFEPFKAPASLIGVGGMYLLASIVLFLALVLVAFFSFGSITDILNDQIDMARLAGGAVILAIIFIPATFALTMAFVFAPVLVHQHKIPVIESIKRSFSGSLRNILPFIVFCIVLMFAFFLLGIFIAIPILGWLLGIAVAIISLPLVCGALFCAYSDIFLHHDHTEL